jgi:hypothetical protein
MTQHDSAYSTPSRRRQKLYLQWSTCALLRSNQAGFSCACCKRQSRKPTSDAAVVHKGAAVGDHIQLLSVQLQPQAPHYIHRNPLVFQLLRILLISSARTLSDSFLAQPGRNVCMPPRTGVGTNIRRCSRLHICCGERSHTTAIATTTPTTLGDSACCSGRVLLHFQTTFTASCWCSSCWGSC